ncbi:hypothetical protein [Mycobacterium uberis]|uniref:hypothetical protein n=1 Tax=Mycobacterium uberis TaxID=2162698 RepID=UPI00311D6BE0
MASLCLPQVLTAITARSTLGMAKLQTQTLFRNPLADPYYARRVFRACAWASPEALASSWVWAEPVRPAQW